MKSFFPKFLAILAVTIFALGCKKDSVIDIQPIDPKLTFETVYKSIENSVNINPNAEFYLPTNFSEAGERQVYTNGILAEAIKNYVWVIKPVPNANWSIKPTDSVLFQINDDYYSPLNFYMLDQVLLPNEFSGASSIFPLENSPASINSPLKASVELWKSILIAPMVASSEVSKGVAYNKQSNKGELIEKRTLTFNAENFNISPTDITKGEVVDLKKWIDPSVKLTDDAPVVFTINNVLVSGYSYTVPTNAPLNMSVHVTKKYANGYFKIEKSVNVK